MDRGMRQSVLIATLLVVHAACGPRPTVEIVRSPMMPRATPAWREIATETDRERLRDWRKTFTSAVASARASGHGGELASEGRLLDPDGALADAAIPDGRYRCRVTKLGAMSEGMLDYIAYPAFACVIGKDGSLQRLDKLTGSQRYVGLIFPDDGMRQTFLGTLVLGDENRAMQYGQDENRNIAGLIERVGERQWRLVMPSPHYELLVDVMELVPAP